MAPLPWLRPTPPQVWAVEPTALQITWGDLDAGAVRCDVGAARASQALGSTTVEHDGGAGSIVVEDLPPNTELAVTLSSPEAVTEFAMRTPPAPPGELLTRIATVSDLHLGSRNWGFLKTIGDLPGHDERYDMRCARAAVTEAQEWGAELLIIKGDAAHHRRARDFALVGELVDSFPDLDMLLTLGNHDVDNSTDIAIPDTVGRRGLPYQRGVIHKDFDGVRVVMGDTSIEHSGMGTIKLVADDLIESAAEASGQVLLAIHHQLQRYKITTAWPPGIAGPESRQFLDRLHVAAPRTLVTAGHVHRCRARRHQSLLVTEVGSTKDFPGVWAGYLVYEGGIYQTARRIASPDAIAWTEHSRRAVGGLWGAWAEGSIKQRCIAVG